MGKQPLRAALAQMNPTVGDIEGNAARIAELTAKAREAGAQLVVFPELALTGYPPEDLLLKTHFMTDARAALEELAAVTHGVVALVGFPELADDAYNAAAVLADGELAAVYRKMHLPNYGVFDEVRYFQAGEQPALIEVDGVLIGLTICEDIWQPGVPASIEALAGAQVIVNISASPYDHGKPQRREQMIVQRARDYLATMAFCALVGGQDELVFDGHSFVCDHEGVVLARSPGFAEDLLICDADPSAARRGRLRDTRHRVAARELEGDVPTLAHLEREPALAGAFVRAYLAGRPARPGFAARFPVYMLDERLAIWEWAQRERLVWWEPSLTLRQWAEPFTSAFEELLA